MTRSAFEQLVRAGREQIPSKFRAYLQEMALVVESEPTIEQKESSGVPADEELLGFYEGTPRSERMYLPYRLPDKISLFQGPLERICDGNAACIQKEVSRTLWHELAHALGTTEDRLGEIEAKRGWHEASS